VTQSFQLMRDSQPLFIDRLNMDGAGAMRQARWGFAGYGVMATLLAFPASDAALQLARTTRIESGMLTATRVDDELVCRCLTTHMHVAKQAFIKLWCALRPLLLGRDAVAPRVWAT
jgi:urease accessory protein